METELKLQIAPANVGTFRRLALLKQFATAKPATRLLRNAYFDTPALHLEEHGMELRVRRVDRVSIQTLEAVEQAAKAGLHRRREWEARVAGPLPELASRIALVEAGSTWEKVLRAPGLAPRSGADLRQRSQAHDLESAIGAGGGGRTGARPGRVEAGRQA